MSKYLRIFNNHSAYTTFTGTSEFIKPNVSLCNNENELHYNRLIIPTGVSLNKSSVNLQPNETETLVATLTPSGAFSDNIVWSSSDETVATVSQAGLVTYVGESGNVTITVTVNGSLTATCNVSSTPSHDYVEIGGVKWATMNVGANSVTDYGLYFQWGDTQGYTFSQFETDKTFDFKNYKWTEDDGSTFTKYNGSDYTVLQPSDDAVTAAWGGNWRMPTSEEFQALMDATTYELTEYDGIRGLLCIDKTDSSKVLFLPCAGEGIENSLVDDGGGAEYWSGSLDSRYVSNAVGIRINDDNEDWYYSEYRYAGLPVRGVIGE